MSSGPALPAHAGTGPRAAYDVLVDPLIRFIRSDGQEAATMLPAVFAALMADDVVAFTALRPHQRHAWHAFLVQLGALSLLRAGLPEPPADSDRWRELLQALTPGQGGTAWALVAPTDQPALLQPALPGNTAAELTNVAATPDALDMLVTSRNHDVKAAMMAEADPDAWLFALVTLQTMEGFLGAGNYGASRMNGGFSNRPALSIAPAGGPGRHVRRDIMQLLAWQGVPPRANPHAGAQAPALLWLEPWDGSAPLAWSRLHPLYIDVCRRVRLEQRDGRLVARVGGSRAARIAGVPDGGITGDPWTPIRPDKAGSKALTVDAAGFGYRPLLKLLFPTDGEPAPLQTISSMDDASGLVVLARALVRGQGKTEGLHERRVRISRRQAMGMRTGATDPEAERARAREREAGEMAGALRFALMSLFQNGPADVNGRHESTARKAQPFLAAFERRVDECFFDALLEEAEAPDAEARLVLRTGWVKGLLRMAQDVLNEADRAAARATNRRFRARVRARALLLSTARTRPSLSQHLEEGRHGP